VNTPVMVDGMARAQMELSCLYVGVQSCSNHERCVFYAALPAPTIQVCHSSNSVNLLRR
jgi:hypothetical protein